MDTLTPPEEFLGGADMYSKCFETHTEILTKMCKALCFRPDLSKNITISKAVSSFWLS